MGFDQRTATPLDFDSDPTLPQGDSSQAHDIPTGVSPTTAKLQDWIAWLRANNLVAPGNVAPDNFTVDANFFVTGSSEIDADLDVGGDLEVGGDLLVGDDAGISGDLAVTGRLRQGTVTYLSDADHTLDSGSAANRVVMLTAPAANRILTLRQSTSPVPINGDWFEVTVLLGASAFTVGLQREGSSDYVAILGDGVGAAGNNAATARVQLVAGVWRLTSVGGAMSFHGGDS